MVLPLCCPYCLTTRERETRDLRAPCPCPDCGSPILLSTKWDALLVLKCPECGTIYEGRDGQPAPGMRPVCTRCGAKPGRETDGAEQPDIGA